MTPIVTLVNYALLAMYLNLSVPFNPGSTPPPATLNNASVKTVCHHLFPFTMFGSTQWVDFPYLGSGTIIAKTNGKNLILTCDHVIDDYCDYVEIVYADNTRRLCHILARDHVKDVAALVTDASVLPTLAKGFSRIDPTDIDDDPYYWHNGYPGGGEQQLRFCSVYQLHKISKKSNWHSGQMSYSWYAEIFPGDSGSAIFNGSGEIVGMIWGANMLGQAEATGAEELRRFCKTHCSNFFLDKQP